MLEKRNKARFSDIQNQIKKSREPLAYHFGFIRRLLKPASRISTSASHRILTIGAWLSLVEHQVRDQGVGGSNPLAPTKIQNMDSAVAAKSLYCFSFLPVLSRVSLASGYSNGLIQFRSQMLAVDVIPMADGCVIFQVIRSVIGIFYITLIDKLIVQHMQ